MTAKYSYPKYMLILQYMLKKENKEYDYYPVSIRGIATNIKTNYQCVSRVVADLIDYGMIERRGDTKNKIIKLSTSGKMFAEYCDILITKIPNTNWGIDKDMFVQNIIESRKNQKCDVEEK